MDMWFYWLRDQEAQGQLRIYWWRGKTNLEDYFTKHHPPAHHVNVRAEFSTRVKDLADSRARTKNEGQMNKSLSYKAWHLVYAEWETPMLYLQDTSILQHKHVHTLKKESDELMKLLGSNKDILPNIVPVDDEMGDY